MKASIKNIIEKINTEVFSLLIGILINFVFIIYALWNYMDSYYMYGDRGRLPQPFSRLRMDIFMDYYNVNFHALTPGFYTDFQSIYSGLFRFFAKVFTSDVCLQSLDAIALRDCDKSFYYLATFLILAISIALIQIGKEYKLKYLWTIFFITSFPLLYMLERGNYIIFSVLLISFLVITKNQRRFNILLAVMPLTKAYFIIYFLIYLKQGIKKVIFYSGALLGLQLSLSWLYRDGFLDQVKNLIGFSIKSYNMFELLVATTFRPLAYYSTISEVVLLAKILVLCAFIRLYIYLSIFLDRELTIKDYKYLILILTLFMLIVIDAIGFYGIVLLYPLFFYFISNGEFTIFEKILIMLLGIAYPINVYKFAFLPYEGVNIFIQVQSIIIPIILFTLFICLTKNIRNLNEN